MPTCKNCHSKLTRYQNDICPVCGTQHPFDEKANSESNDMTVNLSLEQKNVVQQKGHKRMVYLILAFFLGPFGVHLLYLGRKRNAIIWGVVNLLIAAVISVVLFFIPIINWYAILIGVGFIYLANIVFAIISIFNHDLMDKKGNQLV